MAYLSALASLLTVTSGCITDPAVVLDSLELEGGGTPAFDPRLLGNWHTAADQRDDWPPATFEVRAVVRGDRRSYEIVAPWYFTRQVEGQLFRVDDRWIMQVRVSPEFADPREHVAAWHLIGIELDGDKLRVSLLSMHMGEVLARGGGTLRAIRAPQLWVLTDSPIDAIRAAAKRVKPYWVLTLER